MADGITFYCRDEGRGIAFLTTAAMGVVLGAVVLTSTASVLTSASGRGVIGAVGNSGKEIPTVTTSVSFEAYTSVSPVNVVQWSKIGEFSFSMDRTNEAGLRAMDWPGKVLAIRELNDNIVVYGEKGITLMNPYEQTWGFKNIGTVGLKSVWSIDGTNQVHFFITSKGELWKFDEKGPENLGFREFLSVLTNPVLSWDNVERILYISDGLTGYAFRDGLGGGYATLTGINRGLGISSGSLSSVPISIITDTLDLGHRGIKFISFVEVGLNTSQDTFVCLDFRYDKSESWRSSSWVKLNPEGVAKIDIAAVEFRLRVKQNTYDDIRIDYINFRHQRSDKRFLRGPLFEQPNRGEIG